MRQKFSGRQKFSKIRLYVVRLSAFPEIPEIPEIPENGLPFDTGNFGKFKPEVLVEWKAPKVTFDWPRNGRVCFH